MFLQVFLRRWVSFGAVCSGTFFDAPDHDRICDERHGCSQQSAYRVVTFFMLLQDE